jgi:hypothetical protein
MMSNENTFLFEVIVHTMELFVVIGIACSVYYMKKTKKKRNESKNTRQE